MHKIAIVMLVTLLLTSIAHADTIKPLADFAQKTPNGQYIFVMLVDNNNDAYSRGGISTDPIIRQTYFKSGLYHANDPSKIRYSVNWNTTKVELSNNGEYLVRWGPWTSKSDYSDMALEFYHNGRRIKAYKVAEITQNPSKLEHNNGSYTWFKESKFDPHSNMLSVTLVTGERHGFDITTGRSVWYYNGPSLLRYVGSILILIPGWIYWFVRKSHRRRRFFW